MSADGDIVRAELAILPVEISPETLAALARLEAAAEERDEWQRRHEATWARLPKSVQTIYMREYRAALAEAGLE